MQSRPEHPHCLINWKQAIIRVEKLRDYALNPLHPGSGRSKARMFAAVLGFTQADWPALEAAIRGELAFHEAVENDETKYGRKFTVHLPIRGPSGKTAIITTGWIYLVSEPEVPRLATVFVRPRGMQEAEP